MLEVHMSATLLVGVILVGHTSPVWAGHGHMPGLVLALAMALVVRAVLRQVALHQVVRHQVARHRVAHRQVLRLARRVLAVLQVAHLQAALPLHPGRAALQVTLFARTKVKCVLFLERVKWRLVRKVRLII